MGEIKQAVAVRTDLGMGKGKMAAQVGHACVMGAVRAQREHPEWYEGWWDQQKKIVLKVPSILGIREVRRHAAELGLPWAEVADAGHTQLEPGTVTCISVGPAPEDLVDRVTGGLKLL